MKRNIVIEKGKLLVKKFETSDKEIVDYFEAIEPEAYEERFETALKTGVAALKTVGITEKIDYIEKEFSKLNTEFSGSLDDTIKALDDKYLEIFGEKGKFAEIIKEHFGEDGKIMKEIFDPNKEGTPLYELGNAIKKEILELRQQLGIKEREEELMKKSTRKGGNFQELCEEILEENAKVFGDLVENTTNTPGKQNNKKGDFVITIAENQKRIVLEVKDLSPKLTAAKYAASISIPAIQNTLAESIQNRDASYGILVIKSVEALPKSVGWFQEFGNNMLACALGNMDDEEALHEELLLIAYRWARTRIMLQNLKEKHIDADFIHDKITKIKAKLAELNKIKTRCTNIKDTSEEIRNITKQFEEDIGTELNEILGSLVSK